MIGLLKARRTFDPSRGKWVTHAMTCVINDMQAFCRANRSMLSGGGKTRVGGCTHRDPEHRRLAEVAHGVQASLDSPIQISGTDKDHEKTLHDVLSGDLPAADEMAERLEDVRRVRAAMRVLDDRERGIVEALYCNASPMQREVGAVYGIKRQRVYQIAEKALDKLACELESINGQAA
jgi:RNA polymerase sigma factor (sigma-70 family)